MIIMTIMIYSTVFASSCLCVRVTSI